MQKTKIEWTEKSWNPVGGCSRISTGCMNCYAESIAHRFKDTVAKYKGITTNGKFNGTINFDDKECMRPLSIKKPTTFFVSMSDPFHENVTDEMRDKMWAVMALCPQHTFQILTKRPENMGKYLNKQYVSFIDRLADIFLTQGVGHSLAYAYGEEKASELSQNNYILPNVQLGVSVENQEQADKRIPYLLACPAAVRFLSCEPLLGELQLFPNYIPCDTIGGVEMETFIDWVIVGGESGHNARPMHPDWVRSIRDQCEMAGVPFFFKQWGEYAPYLYDSEGKKVSVVFSGNADFSDSITYEMTKVGKKKAGRLLDGKEHNGKP